MKIIFLGTSSAVPTVSRGLSSIAIIRNGELLLFDCGEGTQRAMMINSVGFNRKTKIFITHLHGDHVVGMLGLIQTMSMLNRNKKVDIYGPKEIKGFIEHNIKHLHFSLTFPLIFHPVSEGIILQEEDYNVKACLTRHSTITYAYTIEEMERPGIFNPEIAIKLGIPKGKLWSQIQHGKTISINGKEIDPINVLGPKRPGRKIGFSGDTRPTKKLVSFFLKSNLLIFEATYDDSNLEKAEEKMHSTASEAALIAKKACVKTLILTHFSARYEDTRVIINQASKIHSNVLAASDGMIFDVKYSSP